MKKNILLCFIIPLLIINLSCTAIDTSKLTQEELLLLSYKEKSVDYLNVFFERWQKEIPSTKNIDQLSEDEKIIYEIFQNTFNPVEKNFYTPNQNADFDDIVPVTTPEYNEYINHYMIVQNRISYKFVDSLIFWDDFDTNTNDTIKVETKHGIIEDFRPKLPFTSKIVYLNKKYNDILKNFYTNPIKEQDSKARFLWNAVLITPSRGFFSYPTIDIEIKPTCTEAIIYLNFAFGGSKAIIEKKNGEWKITNIRTIWIE